MRRLLVLTLVLNLGGIGFAGAQRCAASSPAVAQHACCLRQHTVPAAHLAASCGCQMSPAHSAPAPASAVVVPAVDQLMPLLAVAAVLPPVSVPDVLTTDGGPPGTPPVGLLSRLCASGFRC